MEFTSRARHVIHDGRKKMEVRVGDSILANAAAFIASRSRNREAVPCDVLDVDADRVFVRTQLPYRVFTMWVSKEWIEEADCSTETVSA